MNLNELKQKLKKRYSNFKQDKAFWKHKKDFEENSTYAGVRFLDYYASKGLKKTYYSTEIFKEFDKIYIRK